MLLLARAIDAKSNATQTWNVIEGIILVLIF